jgi:hypothetical protein
MNKRNITRKYKIVGTVIKVNGRTVGQVIDGVFVKDVSSSKHFLHTPGAIAYTIDTLHAAQRAGAEYCQVLDTDTGIRYRASIAKIWDMGKKFNYGWGDQIYLTLQNWLQTVDPEYASHTDTVTPEYTDPTDTHHDVKPLVYKSHAPKGVTFTKGVKQLDLWGRK